VSLPTKTIILESAGYVLVSARNCTDYRTANSRDVHTSSEKHGAGRPAMRAMFPQVESLVRLLLVG